MVVIGLGVGNFEGGTVYRLGPWWPNVFHGRMIGGSIHEAKTDFLNAVRYLLRAKIDPYSQCLQHIGAATPAGGGTITMFGYRCARCCREYACTGRDIECASAVATCATRVQGLRCNVLNQVNLHRFFAHHTRQSCYFLYCLTS